MQTPDWSFEQVDFSSIFPQKLIQSTRFPWKTEDILKKAEDLRIFHGSHSFSKTNALGQTFRGVGLGLGIHEMIYQLIYDSIYELLEHKNILWICHDLLTCKFSARFTNKLKHRVPFAWKSSIEDSLNLFLFYVSHFHTAGGGPSFMADGRSCASEKCLRVEHAV